MCNTTVSIQRFGGSEVEIFAVYCEHNGAIIHFRCLMHFPYKSKTTRGLGMGGCGAQGCGAVCGGYASCVDCPMEVSWSSSKLP
jgi:hypothetical protein